MVLSEKEKMVIEDLKTQETCCIEKYGKYSKEAKDSVLKELFETLQNKEREHLDSLNQVLTGSCPKCDCNDRSGQDYSPKATYQAGDNSSDKKNDCFLATDCIASEKMVSSEYNTNVFVFGQPVIRKLLADIQIEEQNHAEMLYKYKVANGMA